jgi:DNA-directed RNA polymerase I, II, and III subunit RPABC2
MADDEGDYGVEEGGEDAFEAIDAIDIDDDTEKKDDPFASLLKHHSECIVDYAEVVASKIPLTSSTPFEKDSQHRSPPFLTQYERTKIIGMRANQLSQGARPYIPIPEHIKKVEEIARLELQQRRLPFIVKRPMPDGTHEYWRLSDLLIL